MRLFEQDERPTNVEKDDPMADNRMNQIITFLLANNNQPTKRDVITRNVYGDSSRATQKAAGWVFLRLLDRGLIEKTGWGCYRLLK